MSEPNAQQNLTPRAQRHLDFAARAAEETTGRPIVGTEHLLLAMLRDQHSIAYQVIAAETPIAPLLSRLTALLASPSYTCGT